MAKCEIKAFVFASTADDEFRKPAIGTFDFFWEFIGRKSTKNPKSDFNQVISGQYGSLGKRSVLNECLFPDETINAYNFSQNKRKHKHRNL